MMRSNLAVPGSLAAAFLSGSITAVLFGLMVYFRSGFLNPILEIYPPAGTFSGIWLFSYLIWLILWVVSYFALRHRDSVGTLSGWTAVLLVAILASILLAEASFDWSTLFS
jgi:hypothetical protein